MFVYCKNCPSTYTDKTGFAFKHTADTIAEEMTRTAGQQHIASDNGDYIINVVTGEVWRLYSLTNPFNFRSHESARSRLDSKIKSMNSLESFISMQYNEQPTIYERGGLVYSGRAYIDAEVHVSFHGNDGLIFYEFKLADPSGINLTEGGENTYKGGMGFTHTGFSKGGGRIIIKGIVYCMN